LSHFHVEQNDVRHAQLAGGEKLVRMRKGSNGVQPVVLERVFEVVAEVGIVVENRKRHQPIGAARFQSLFRRRS